MRTTRTLLLPAALALSLSCSLLACGGGGGGGGESATGDGDVASLSGDVTDTKDDAQGGGTGGGGPDISPAVQDAMVAFAECMRAHGIDMPDPVVNGSGGMVIVGGPGARATGVGGAGSDTPIDLAEMEAAQEACQPIMDAVQSEMPRPDPAELERMRTEALAFAECMREHGVDMPDPQFSDDGGGIAIAIGSAEAGEGGPPAAMIDPSDDDFQEAQEACGGDDNGFSVSTSDAGEDDDQ